MALHQVIFAPFSTIETSGEVAELGRMHRSWKPAKVYPFRGFESHPLRHIQKKEPRLSGLFRFYRARKWYSTHGNIFRGFDARLKRGRSETWDADGLEGVRGKATINPAQLAQNKGIYLFHLPPKWGIFNTSNKVNFTLELTLWLILVFGAQNSIIFKRVILQA